MRGPLPDPNARRRNAPTIPTTALPASGRGVAAPDVPAWVSLGEAGAAWWVWAWSTPQACGWDSGSSVFVSRRAALEDLFTVSPSTACAREMREIDDRLGLTPKGMAALRWKIVADVVEDSPAPENVTSMEGRRKRLTDAS